MVFNGVCGDPGPWAGREDDPQDQRVAETGDEATMWPVANSPGDWIVADLGSDPGPVGPGPWGGSGCAYLDSYAVTTFFYRIVYYRVH